jgi:dihydroorotate dehydrogenase
MFFQPVYSGDPLDKVALRIVTYVYGEPGSHVVVRGAPTAF